MSLLLLLNFQEVTSEILFFLLILVELFHLLIIYLLARASRLDWRGCGGVDCVGISRNHCGGVLEITSNSVPETFIRPPQGLCWTAFATSRKYDRNLYLPTNLTTILLPDLLQQLLNG